MVSWLGRIRCDSEYCKRQFRKTDLHRGDIRLMLALSSTNGPLYHLPHSHLNEMWIFRCHIKRKRPHSVTGYGYTFHKINKRIQETNRFIRVSFKSGIYFIFIFNVFVTERMFRIKCLLGISYSHFNIFFKVRVRTHWSNAIVSNIAINFTTFTHCQEVIHGILGISLKLKRRTNFYKTYFIFVKQFVYIQNPFYKGKPNLELCLQWNDGWVARWPSGTVLTLYHYGPGIYSHGIYSHPGQ